MDEKGRDGGCPSVDERYMKLVVDHSLLVSKWFGLRNDRLTAARSGSISPYLRTSSGVVILEC